jgi:ubiquinone/menaquinone biosynthesis C-methylase UbiE
MRQESSRIFENFAQEYDAWFEQHLPVYESEIRAVKELLPPSGEGLEIGVGTGRFAAPLGIEVGVEPAKAMATIARKRGIKVYAAYAEELPFEDESFDFILIITVLCFLADPFRAFREAARVLKPEGRLIIGMIDQDSPLGRSYEASKEKSKFYRQARFYSVSQVLKWLKDLGYQNPQTCQTIFQDLSAITGPEPVKAGHGEGGFVVIATQKSV